MDRPASLAFLLTTVTTAVLSHLSNILFRKPSICTFLKIDMSAFSFHARIATCFWRCCHTIYTVLEPFPYLEVYEVLGTEMLLHLADLKSPLPRLEAAEIEQKLARQNVLAQLHIQHNLALAQMACSPLEPPPVRSL